MKVILLPGTRRRLALIHQYISHERSKRMADHVLRKIKKRIAALPGDHGAQVVEELRHLGQDHRKTSVGPYKIIFLVLGNEIHVTDVFDGRRDPNEMKG